MKFRRSPQPDVIYRTTPTGGLLPLQQGDGSGSLTREAVDALATYNAERSRGIVHSPEWQAFMAEVQELFDYIETMPRAN